MSASRINYKIYPSLLDGFQRMCDADIDAEAAWNLDEEGMPKRTADELYAEREQALLDSINRVPHEPIEAADKGMAFNAAVDFYGSGDIDARVALRSVSDEQYGEQVEADINGFSFRFAYDLVAEAAQYFEGSVTQHLCKALILTRYGVVELYGYADEIRRDKVYDIKTTGRYSFGDYGRKWQKEVYPYCLIESGEMKAVSEFEYTVYVWGYQKQGAPLTATQYREVYQYDHAKATERLRAGLEQFIGWLEAHREQITDKKIFGYE